MEKNNTNILKKITVKKVEKQSALKAVATHM